MNIHHFALDGISVANDVNNPPNEIKILNSRFEYNSRQGFSWIGGNGLYVNNCKFNHTGKGKFESPPGAGMDIEAERGPIRNGIFENCEFVDNAGCGIVSDNGDAADCSFKNCTFWGSTNWSIWTTNAGFTFSSCNIYGSAVHGYDSPNEKDATKFIDCHFEDKTYNGKEPYGNYLVESNSKKRMYFSGCSFLVNSKKLFWAVSTTKNPEEQYKFTDCTFIVNTANYAAHDFVAVTGGNIFKNCTFEFMSKEAKLKGLYLDNYELNYKVNENGNKVIYH